MKDGGEGEFRCVSQIPRSWWHETHFAVARYPVVKNFQSKNLSVRITLSLWNLAMAVSVMKLMKVCLHRSPFEYNLEEIFNCLELRLADRVLPLSTKPAHDGVWYLSDSRGLSTQRNRDVLDKGPHHFTSLFPDIRGDCVYCSKAAGRWMRTISHIILCGLGSRAGIGTSVYDLFQTLATSALETSL